MYKQEEPDILFEPLLRQSDVFGSMFGEAAGTVLTCYAGGGNI